MDDMGKIVAFSATQQSGDQIHGAGHNRLVDIIKADSAWTAFNAGMLILRRYADHTPVDENAIAKSNFQLLYNALSNNAKYCNALNREKCSISSEILPKLEKFSNNPAIQADIITVADGCSCQLANPPHYYTMYLVLAGNGHTNLPNKPSHKTKYWWNKFNPEKMIKLARSGTIINIQESDTTIIFTTLNSNCVLLSVRISLDNSEIKAAS